MFALGLLGLFGCTDKQSSWTYKEQILLEDISPVGIASDGNNLWLSDPDNNRVVKIDLKGKVLKEILNLQRPMHIAYADEKLYVPEYLTDTISIFENGKKSVLSVSSKLNAPAGIAVTDNTIAIADFYNHRIILKEGEQEIIIGKEGHNQGELYYPTDVEIYKGRIYVADAYNNRVQVFDKQGNSLQLIGEKDNINVATGITLLNEQIFVTDFKGNRVLIYDLDGALIQVLVEDFDKPADVIQHEKQLIVVNYKGKNMVFLGQN